jgi:signal transduction histidine kinase
MKSLKPTYDELCQNTRLLIRLRWIAGFSILAGTLVARVGFDIHLQILPLLLTGLIVLAYNSLLFYICRTQCDSPRSAWRIAWGQIILDWIAMTALVHFTGGITSPALIYFVIHAAFSGMILLPWQTRSLSILAITIIAWLGFFERWGTLPHVVIPGLGLDGHLYQDRTYIAAVLFFFGTTVIALSELVSAKAQVLRQHEAHIQQLYDARSTFMHVATHELRAPTAAGLSLVRNIEAGYVGELNPQQAALIHRVAERLEGLSTLIDDLLTLAASREAHAAHAPLEPVEVRQVVQRMVEREMPNADQKQIQITLDLDEREGVVMAAEDGLEIIFGNLLNNAIKYTPNCGQVIARYRIDAAQTDVTIIDTGIGIPANDLPQIFGEFFRAKNAKAAQITGSGIGLSIVRTLVDRYHGEVSISSKEGTGTTVIVSFPLKKS